MLPIDIETIPEADKGRHLQEAKDNFKAPSGLTKAEMGKDLGIGGEKLKFTSAADLKAQWEAEMAATKSDEVGDIAWRKTALDATYGRIVCIGWRNKEESQSITMDNSLSEKEGLTLFFHKIGDLLRDERRTPYFIGHNVTFDLKFLFRRAVILGVKPPFDLPFRGRHGNEYFCTMRAWCEHGERISLKNLSAALGINGKDGFDGSMICDAWLNKEYDKIASYCRDDVDLTYEVFKRLTFC